MPYPTDKPTGNYELRNYDFASNDSKKIPMDEYTFKMGYKNADESDLESVPDAHEQNWMFDILHRNLRYTKQVAEENKNQLETKLATPTSIGQVKIGYGLEITSNGVLSVVKDIAQDANIVSYDLPVGSYMLWAGNNTPEYFIEPKGQELLRASYPDLWEFAQSNNLVATDNTYVSGKLFGVGDGLTTFKVFDIRGKFLKVANDNIPVGTYEEAGLPNITGSMTNAYRGAVSGAFAYNGQSSDGGDDRTTYHVTFDASRSSDIYGKSNTVTPENYALKLILKALPTPPSNAVPTGTILDYTANSAPDGYIIANGAELSRTTFAKLYGWALANNLIIDQASIPTTAHGFYGSGDGSTTFTIPDLRGVHKRGSDLASNRGGTSLGGYLADGGMGGFPDFTKVTNIGSGYKATQNGYVFLMAQTDGNSVVTISNFSNTYSYDTGDGQSAGSTFIPIKKGDTISFSRTSRAAFMPVDSSTYGVNKSVAVNYIIRY